MNACAAQEAVGQYADEPHEPASAEATATPFLQDPPNPTYSPGPETFQSSILRPGIEPVAYIADSCAYLEMRWDPQNSKPGTVVAPIMFHGIVKGNGQPTQAQDINFETFEQIIALAEDLGFETITTDELVGFLTENAKIPPRSMILILDDRRPGTAEDYFLPVNERNDWTTTLAWIAQADTEQRKGRLPGESLWDWIERIYATGYFDVQSHGLNHRLYLVEGLPEEVVREEIAGSILVLEEHFGQRPIAYIWPGGDYTFLGIQVAREAGFKLGFTVQSRGPILFNWIPQGEKELAHNDPLMLLPRFWSSAALRNLEQTTQIGDDAAEFAKQNYAAEANWYSTYCGGRLPPLEDVLK
ncbi:MAG: polysaccharide deacetylase family protein [Anaerolineales bacterium]